MSFWNDLQLAARTWRKSPAFTATATLTLALGVGASTAMFSIVQAVLLRPLPFPQADQLVWVVETSLGITGTASLPDLLDWRAQARSFQGLGGYTPGDGFTLAGGERPERVAGIRISPGLLATLGARPLLGRLFLPEEEVEGRDGVVILGENLWKRRFGAVPDIVGRRVRINSEPRTVVGVVPAWLHFPPQQEAPSQVFVPLAGTAAERQQRGNRMFFVVGRLRGGVSVAQAQAEMDGIARDLAQKYPAENADRGVRLTPLQAWLVGGVRQPLWVLFGAVGMLLAIACANVANLLLARAAGRSREAAVRTALGAGHWQLASHFLAEGLLLALLGAGLALPAGAGALRLLRALAPSLPRIHEIALDGRVLLFTLTVALATGVVFSLAPIWQVGGKLDPGEALRAGGRATSGAGGRRLRSALVVGEVALSLLLLAGAGLLLRSLWYLSRVDPGLRTRGVLTADLALPALRYDTPARRAAGYGRLLARLSALPGVTASGMTSLLPIRTWGWNAPLSVEGAPPPPAASFEDWVETRQVSPGYFATLGIELAKGRLLDGGDSAEAPRVVVINQAAARHFWPAAADPIGARVRVEGGSGTAEVWRVVGVVRNVRNTGLIRQARPEAYFPYAQAPPASVTLVARTPGEPLALAAALRRTVVAEDRELALDRITTMDRVVSESVGRPRFNATLLGIFAGLAVSLAAIGLYGVLAYLVVQRTQEIAVRVALGASAREIRRLVGGECLRLVLPGMAMGLAAAVALRRVLAGLLYGVGPLDAPTLAAVAVGLGVVALAASIGPAWRAAGVEPMAALRRE